MTSMNVWVLIAAVTLALLALVFVVARTGQKEEGRETSKQRARRAGREDNWAVKDAEREAAEQELKTNAQNGI